MPLSVLITNVQLTGRTGTEIVVRDLEQALRGRGHQVAVFSPACGEIAAEIERAGGTVIDDLGRLPWRPDIIHGHHHVQALEACVQFPDVPAVFVCHDREAWHDLPPVLGQIVRYVAVDLNCRERLLGDVGIDPSRVRTIHNAVDLDRFPRRAALPATARRAVVFSNSARAGGYLDVIEAAGRIAGLEVVAIGDGVGRTSSDPSIELRTADIVFAKARCAIEALATGCAVVLADAVGLGEMVTEAQVGQLRDWNFGARCLQRQIDVDAVLHEICRYRADDATRAADAVRAASSLDLAVDAWESLYDEAIEAYAVHGSAATVMDSVRSLAQHATDLGRLVRHGPDGLGVARLVPPGIAAAFDLGIVRCDRGTDPDAPLDCEVELVNRSRETLVSAGRQPVQFAYHWRRVDTGEVVVWEGHRTRLTRPLLPGERITQSLTVVAPSEPGRFTLEVTLVQESVAWFDGWTPPLVAITEVTVGPERVQPGRLDLARLDGRFGLAVARSGEAATLSFVGVPARGMLAFAETVGHLRAAVAAGAVACIVPPGLVELVDEVDPAIGVLVAEAPRRSFADLHRWLAEDTEFYGRAEATVVDPSADVHPTAWIDPSGVMVGAAVRIGPRAVITGRAHLAPGVEVDAGAVVGAAGFQSDGGREMPHAGTVSIGVGTRVFANAVIARGVFHGATRIGARCRVGNLAFVSHHCTIGDDVHIGHGATVNGGVSVGDGAWVGPGVDLANGVAIGARARVSLGSTVIGDVAADGHVTGAVAIDHWSMLREVASWRRRRR